MLVQNLHYIVRYIYRKHIPRNICQTVLYYKIVCVANNALNFIYSPFPIHNYFNYCYGTCLRHAKNGELLSVAVNLLLQDSYNVFIESVQRIRECAKTRVYLQFYRQPQFIALELDRLFTQMLNNEQKIKIKI